MFLVILFNLATLDCCNFTWIEHGGVLGGSGLNKSIEACLKPPFKLAEAEVLATDSLISGILSKLLLW